MDELSGNPGELKQAQGSKLSGGLDRMVALREEVSRGGPWLGAARTWMQNNVRDGDRLNWSSRQEITLPFCALEELALAVAIAAITEERQKAAV